MSQDNNNETVDDTQEFCGYPTFRGDASKTRLCAYNRILTYLRIWNERNSELASQYIKHFSLPERSEISNVYNDIKERGIGIVRLEIKEGKRYV